MRQYIIAANWKMNKTLEEGQKLASEIINRLFVDIHPPD